MDDANYYFSNNLCWNWGENIHAEATSLLEVIIIIESQLSDIRYFIHKIKAHYVGLIYSEEGLISCTLPLKNKKRVEETLKPLLKEITEYDQVDSPTEAIKEITLIIYRLHFEPKKYWKQSLKINLDFSHYTENEKRVLQQLRKTLPGETISYKKLADLAGYKNASRFIGSTMRKNNTPLIIPCHRVIRSDGKLGNYSAAGGIIQKRKYLDLEKD